MTKEEFEIITKPLSLLDEPYKTFMQGALLGNFINWQKAEQLTLTSVVRQSEQLKEKKSSAFDDWIKLNYRYYTNSIYIGKKDNTSYHFKELEKYYDKIKDSL